MWLVLSRLAALSFAGDKQVNSGNSDTMLLHLSGFWNS